MSNSINATNANGALDRPIRCFDVVSFKSDVPCVYSKVIIITFMSSNFNNNYHKMKIK